jgi:hypothetical protein
MERAQQTGRTGSLARWLLLLSIAGLLPVLILFTAASIRTQHTTGFVRTWLSFDAQSDTIVLLGDEGYYLAGFTASNIFLSNVFAPARVMTVDRTTLAKKVVTLDSRNTASAYWRYMRTFVDSPFIYIREGVTPSAFKASFHDMVLRIDTPVDFTTCAYLPSRGFFYRRADGVKKTQSVVRYKAEGEKQLIVSDNFNLFENDGKLIADASAEKLLFVFSFKNKFAMIDTTLRSIRTINTINPAADLHILQDSIPEEGKLVMRQNVPVANILACADDNLLVIVSGVQNSDLSDADFKSHYIFDIYSLNGPKYAGSILSRKLRGRSLQHIGLTGDQLLLFYEDAMQQLSLKGIRSP